MSPSDQMIRRFRVRLGTYLVLKDALRFGAAWGFLWGTAVLVLRAAFGTPWEPLLWGGVGVPLVLVPAVWLAVCRLPAPSRVRALLDQRSRCGGLLMAGEELPLAPWTDNLPALVQPRVRWQARRSVALFGVSAAYVLLSFLLPQRLAALGSRPRLEIDREVEKLEKQIDVLKEETLLDPKRADSLKSKLQQLREEASGMDPVKTLEALDHLEDVTARTAKEAATAAAKQNEKLAKSEALADALAKSGEEMKPQVRAEAMAELAARLEEARAESEMLDGTLDEDTLEAAREGKLSKEQLDKLSKALKGSKKDLKRRLKRLTDAGLIDLDKLRECESCAECDAEKLAKCLCECEGKARLDDLLARCNRPGRGGLTRGPGAAPLTFEDKPSSEEGIKFKETVLPPAALKELKDSRLQGVSRTAPQVNQGGEARSGALEGAAAGGGSAAGEVVLPRHRGSVERYFDRPERPK